MSDQTINIPQLLIVILVGAFAVRYLFFSGSNTASSGSNRNSANNVRAREADVERIQQMFPQVSRRNIMWDLQRNGGNVVATTERILSGRGLEVPPQSFQPPLPSTPVASSTSVQPSKPSQPDLITRYNLKAKLAEEQAEKREAEERESKQKQGGGQAWSSNKNERQALLQRRREEMILAARRKMEAKVAKEVEQSGSG
ncbi:hypothetical protein SS1G_07725 [Sclerotinia sclerotiorum 1980 UF-70]|uniref:Coupling of ubiquitin conjugation to ER degradation protein 1 n=2 Tax=Sclerotinia sclerotiorum (strain ATCC 18683 / 1980 / Ss-1) TaxID=665079 RepID=A7EQX2_SCLS1|nr:hypothetical protein SS1G_07725 [Sclerotinia sclerotiorum 1980 UF-70]APA13616.1 hypothetical protein sscle_11g083860 [Sclerotinia sclerotiorum 1980 UF-70]EDN91864.1 hypothetical protein SS1G_07725 [Sclerotinia sclerotiorum 1980 UF-70]